MSTLPFAVSTHRKPAEIESQMQFIASRMADSQEHAHIVRYEYRLEQLEAELLEARAYWARMELLA